MNICFGNKMISYDSNGIMNGLGSHLARKLNQVHLPAQKIVYIDESERTVNNGEYNPTVLLNNADDPSKDYTAIAERHELKLKRNSQDARGNVSFADGHAEVHKWKSGTSIYPVRYNTLPTPPRWDAIGKNVDYAWYKERTGYVIFR